MQNNDQILEAIEHYLGQIGYPEEPGRLYAPISYSLTMTGKRLRHMLLMLTCGIFSDQPQAAMPAAAAVEVFHNFTLLHDDIMDNAAMRRGNPSVFAKWESCLRVSKSTSIAAPVPTFSPISLAGITLVSLMTRQSPGFK